MVYKNEVLNKYTKPYYLASGMFLVLGVLATTMMANSIKEDKRIQEDAEKRIMQNNYNYSLCVLLIVFCFGAGIFGIASTARDVRKKTEKIAEQFLQYMMNAHPELRKYDSVLNNPKAIMNIAEFVCNSLSEDDKMSVAHIAKEFNEIKSQNEQDVALKMKSIEDKILYIVKQHVKKHPDFVAELGNIMANANKTYVMPTQQYTR